MNREITKEIIIAGQKINYTIKRQKGFRNLRLTINSQGQLKASRPWFLSVKAVERFVQNQIPWIAAKLEYCQAVNNRNPFRQSRAEYLAYKQAAARLITRKVNQHNQAYQFRFGQISIRCQKTRWGSCSSRGNLNFNYKIIFLPEKIIDYIIVHELCHLKELNHSSRFWDLVARQIPDHQARRQDLQKRGIELR
jgi:hypothetical protein